METIRVNMTPCEDVQTIHASQNDGEARQWGFKLHNNGDVIDSSEVTDQMVFKAYKGGTEQLLPENGSTPTTSPFLGDIRYPQGLLTSQEFLYRESPTESDGLAWIKSIKGNTIVWNQLVPIGETSKSTTIVGVTITDNRDGSYTFNGTATATQYLWLFNRQAIPSFIKPNHKYLIRSMASNISKIREQFILYGTTAFSKDETAGNILTTPSDFSSYTDFGLVIQFISGNTFTNEKLYPVLIDLTEMGLDSLDADGFASLFPLSYYAYNADTLLSFNGTGIKTVGKNLIDPSLVEYQKNWEGSANISRAVCYLSLPYGTYTFSIQDMGTLAEISVSVTAEKYGQRYSLGNLTNSAKSRTVTINADRPYAQFLLRVTSGTITQEDFESCHLMIESGSTATDYESYIESSLSFPILTYFPTGMKSAGSVYDELTETKAITRIGAVDLGSLEWYYNISSSRFITTVQLTDAKRVSNNNEVPNMVCPLFEAVSLNVSADTSRNKTIAIGSSDGNLRVRDSSFTDANAFTQAMSGVYLYYELATESETSFATASLVTENAEIPLSNNDGVLIGKCTEQLSENPGFIDAKIKLSDSDGTCYSNKIQLHIERSPQ